MLPGESIIVASNVNNSGKNRYLLQLAFLQKGSANDELLDLLQSVFQNPNEFAWLSKDISIYFSIL